MYKDILFKIAAPIACALAVAFAPIGASAAQYYNNNNCCATDCCDPCQPDPCCAKKSGWLGNAAIFLGAAAVGAIAGVVAAESNKKRGRSGTDGTSGTNGTNGTNGIDGLGFVILVSPPGQPDAGAPVTQLTFTFTTLLALTLLPGIAIETYVTTPDGRTVLGGTLTGLIGPSATVNLTGQLFAGQYNVGVVLPAALVSLAGLVSVQVTSINGVAPATALDEAGIVVSVTLLSAVDKFFNTQYPISNTAPVVP